MRIDRDDRDTDAELGLCRLGTVQEPLHGAEADEHRGDGDHDHLDERGKRLGLAVPEAVVVVGRRSGDTNAKQHDEAGDQIQRRCPQASQASPSMKSA